MVNARAKMKTWPVIFCCLNTSAIHIKLLHSYSAQAFMLGWNKFVSIRGRPNFVYSDQGTQLSAGAKSIAATDEWDWKKIANTLATEGIT